MMPGASDEAMRARHGIHHEIMKVDQFEVLLACLPACKHAGSILSRTRAGTRSLGQSDKV